MGPLFRRTTICSGPLPFRYSSASNVYFRSTKNPNDSLSSIAESKCTKRTRAITSEPKIDVASFGQSSTQAGNPTCTTPVATDSVPSRRGWDAGEEVVTTFGSEGLHIGGAGSSELRTFSCKRGSEEVSDVGVPVAFAWLGSEVCAVSARIGVAVAATGASWVDSAVGTGISVGRDSTVSTDTGVASSHARLSATSAATAVRTTGIGRAIIAPDNRSPICLRHRFARSVFTQCRERSSCRWYQDSYLAHSP